jgi:hypothetical protein
VDRVTTAECVLPYPTSCIPAGGVFGDWSQLRKSAGLGPHRGVDFSAFHADQLGLSHTYRSVTDGVVTSTTSRYNPVLGHVVEVLDDEGWYWLYCHNSVLLVKEGDRVHAGVTPLAVMGETGTAAQAVHLHLALSRTKNGGAIGAVVDPIAHIEARLKEEDPDVVSTAGSYTYTYKNPLELSTTDWKTVSIDAHANSSFVTDFDGIVYASVATRLSGLPAGATVQARLQIVTVENGKTTAVAYSDVVELQGSGGDAFPSFSDGVSIKKNQRLRLVLLAQHEGVTVKRTAVTVLRFQRS